jgi:alpha,alpha-trehalose phosphorylase
MLHRARVRLPEHVYPADKWKLIETHYYPRLMPATETIFSVGNGYIGMRGNFDEGTPVHQTGTFVNGFHETWPIEYGEDAHGFAKTGQTMVNVTDTKVIKLYVDDEPFYLPTATLLDYYRALDMQTGVLERDILWETPAGKLVRISSRRLVSFEHRHVAAISYEVTVLNSKAPVVISSEALNHLPVQGNHGDPRKTKGFPDRVLVTEVARNESGRIVLGQRAKSSGMTIACGVDHLITSECRFTATSKVSDTDGKVVVTATAEPDKPLKLVKYITYHTSRSTPSHRLCERAERTLDRSMGEGFSGLIEGQREFLDEFWGHSDLLAAPDPQEAKANPEQMQQSIHFNLFQVLQACGRVEGAGVPAKGLTGQTYEGHYFWDTEIYVLPFLIYTQPRIAKNLLKFRHSMLDKARQRAREVNQRGALFPWRTINGEEASSYYAAGTAQYHINADIAYALKKYVDVTGDLESLYEFGAEMLVETARLWVDLGFYSDRYRGQFVIHGVTGPDEYNAVVNNNTYTNLMARENLRFAVKTVQMMQDDAPEKLTTLIDRTGLNMRELEQWQTAAEMMYIPYDQETMIHPQDDSFLDKEPWDFDRTPMEMYPLLLHFHPLVIYRSQIIKQVDVVLAMFLLDHEFSPEEKKRNFDFYDARTTGDSSLSVGVQSIMAAEIGYLEKAAQYARYAVLMDLGDVGGNVSDGCHIASMGGTWMVFVYGFGGMRDWDGRISFDPQLPREAGRLKFPLQIRGSRIEVDISRDSISYKLLEGDSITVYHRQEEVTLTSGDPVQTKKTLTKKDPDDSTQPGFED